MKITEKVKITERKAKIIFISICLLALVITGVITYISTQNKEGEITKKPVLSIKVTADEMAEYKEKIGTDMDVKRSIIVLFNSKDEAQNFINQNGSKDVLSLNIGIIPRLEENEGVKYYNIVGSGVFEPVFDSLKDGEFAKEPILFGGMWAYFKRIDIYRPLENEKDLKTFIQNEKSIKKEGASK